MANHALFSSIHAGAGQSLQAFQIRLVGLLCKSDFVEKHLTDLKAVGYTTGMERQKR
ncbi:hypothetical protein [Acinetobacter sp. HY1485]|uniref:hypothetical protein n=1 Tax=Acinetobacter sp. HY1485 TaxID=2970918 RepID=UPI0022B9A8E2|nr:hypothetical protein [Acinetobacter sp. HY1485]